jgi:hypothetical protein
MMIGSDREQAKQKALMLAALCGSKIALGPAFLARSGDWPSARSWMLAAIGEMTLDKLGVFPPRWRPSLLLPHTAAGAWTAYESLRRDGIYCPATVAKAAGVAASVALAAPAIRVALSQGVGLPDILLALVEDYIALNIGTKTMGISFGEIGHEARESLEEVKDRVMPALQSVGVGA